jgi:hypothetical protein
MGRNFGMSDWLHFLAPDHLHKLADLPDDLADLQTRFEELIAGMLAGYAAIDSRADGADITDTAYLAFATLSGEGIGLWEGREDWHEGFSDYMGASDELAALHTRITCAMYDYEGAEE